MAMMTSSELADELKVSLSTLARWRQLGMPCMQSPNGGSYRYDTSSVQEWLGAMKQGCKPLVATAVRKDSGGKTPVAAAAAHDSGGEEE